MEFILIVQYSYSLSYILLTALSAVFISHAGTVVPPALTLFIATLLCILFFHLFNLSAIKTMYSRVWQLKWAWFRTMLVVTTMWLSTIYGPTLISPANYILLYFVSSCLLGFVTSGYIKNNLYYGIAVLGITICTTWILFLSTPVPVSSASVIGILLGVLGGASLFLYSKQSHWLSREGQLSATQVLAVRFWLSEVVSLLMLPADPWQYLSWYGMSMILLVAITALILPIFLFIKGVLTIGAEKNAILCGLIPTTTYVLQSIFSKEHNMSVLILNIATAFFIILPYLYRSPVKMPK